MFFYSASKRPSDSTSLLLSGLMLCTVLAAQTWYLPLKGYNLHGQGWTSDIGKKFQRMPSTFQASVPTSVWNLSFNSAGIYVRFKTNATNITVS